MQSNRPYLNYVSTSAGCNFLKNTTLQKETFSKINKRAGWNKRVGRKISENVINVQDGIRRACKTRG